VAPSPAATTTTQVASCSYRFGGRFELQPAERRLLVDGKATQLPNRAFDLLVMLVERAGQLVTNVALLHQVWPGLVVESSNIDVQMTKLRKLLGKEAIQNERQHGYRFTLPVEVIVVPAPSLDKLAQKARDARVNNLPAQTSPFIGRENEIRAMRTQLADGRVRLLTLSGVAGTGKTRLALQAAADLVAEFEDGVLFVPLAALRDPALVLPTIAQAFAVREASGKSLLEELKGYLRHRQFLLVLDNFEQVIDAAPVVTDLLSASSRLKALVTSREVLRVSGETDYPVPPLSLPDPKRLPPLERLTQYEALALFIERARAVKPAFAVTNENAPAVAEICHRLDGLPLAIELAAARVRVLPPQRMLAELSHRLTFLIGGARDLSERQRTMRGAIDWSHDLLTGDEQKLFRRLAVFVGGCALKAIDAVCNIENNLPVLETVESLVGKSLVRQTEADGEPRFAMLETIREYAGDRLNDSTEGEAVRARHLAFYLALAEDARLGLIGAQQRKWLQQLDLERENLLVAHRSCDKVPDGAAMGLRLVFALRMYWGSRGLLELGKRVTLGALARTGAQVRNVKRCLALFAAGQIETFMGQYGEGRIHLEESLAIADEVGEQDRRGSITTTLALAALGQGDHIAAQAYFEKAIDLSRESGNKRELAASLNGLAQLKRMQGALDAADRLYQQALALMRELVDWQSSAFILLNLAIVAVGRKAKMPARESLQAVLAISVEMQSKPIGQCALDVCAALAALWGDWKRAARFFGVVDAQMGETGYQRDPADEAFVAPKITQARKVLGTETFDRANSDGRGLSYDDAINEANVWLTSLADRGGDAQRRRH
jgi:predicted ATPase/DNA-binding winged helix-turn-helix (wHTH) protein